MSSILESSQSEVFCSAESLNRQFCVFPGPGESRLAAESYPGAQGIHQYGECPELGVYTANEGSGER